MNDSNGDKHLDNVLYINTSPFLSSYSERAVILVLVFKVFVTLRVCSCFAVSFSARKWRVVSVVCGDREVISAGTTYTESPQELSFRLLVSGRSALRGRWW